MTCVVWGMGGGFVSKSLGESWSGGGDDEVISRHPYMTIHALVDSMKHNSKIQNFFILMLGYLIWILVLKNVSQKITGSCQNCTVGSHKSISRINFHVTTRWAEKGDSI